jgi:xanthine dehydrogenase accessory factor
MQSLDVDVFESLLAWQNAGHHTWLVTVTQTFGASPRPPGSVLAIRDDGIVIGSVSGGCIEDDIVAKRDSFIGCKPHLLTYGITSDEAHRFGLPCGGTLEVIVEAGTSIDQIERLLAHIRGGSVIERRVNLSTGEWSFAPAEPTQQCFRDEHWFGCVHGPKWRLLIIGGSEIARFLAEVASTLDFQVSVCDPRDEYKTAWRVPSARWLDGMPDDVVLAFKPDGHTVIVTVSHDPKIDDMALLEALKTSAFYIGAVGSKKTSAERRARLGQFDLTSEQIAKLRGPTGLRIGSRTPAEIAVAILAELIAQRNRIELKAQE